MKSCIIVLSLLAAVPALAQSPAQTPAQAGATAPASRYSVQASTLGQLVDNPQTKLLLEKHFPEVANHPQLTEGLGLTLPEVVQYLPDVITPAKLAAMDADLKAIP